MDAEGKDWTKWVDDSAEFGAQLGRIVELWGSDPEKAVEQIDAVERFVVETGALALARKDQYLAAVARAMARMEMMDESLETIDRMRQDVFHKIYELIKIADRLIAEEDFDKAEKILRGAEVILPTKSDIPNFDRGFKGRDLERVGDELRMRIKDLEDRKMGDLC